MTEVDPKGRNNRLILIDGDACPVKEEIYKCAYRHNIPVRLVAGSYLRHPAHPLITMVMAGDAFAGPKVEGAHNSGLAAAHALLS